MFEFSKNKLSIIDIWKVSFDLYKQTLSKVWYLAFFMILVLLGCLNLAMKMMPVPSKTVTGVQNTQPIPHLPVTGILFYLIALIVGLFLLSVILHRMYNLATNPNYSLSSSIIFILSKFLIIFSSMAIVYLTAIAGLLLFIIPGVFIGILFMFSLLAIIFEDSGWLSAIKRSCQLVWSNWWRTFVIFLVPAILLVVVQNGLSFIIGVRYLWLNILVVSLVISVLKPYIDAVLLVQFNDLKLRK